MASLENLSALQFRQIATVVGSLVADAAAQPLHWVYKDDVLRPLTDGVEEIEFKNPSANPFFKIPVGNNSCYGDLAYSMLKSLVASNGLSIPHLTGELFSTFGPDSAYGELDEGNRETPIERPWRNHGIRQFVHDVIDKKEETGCPTDDQIDCVVEVIPLVALYAGHPDLLDKVADAVSIIQRGGIAIAYSLAAARVLEQYILHQDPKDVLQTVIKAINSPDNPKPQMLDQTVVESLQQVIELLNKTHAEVLPEPFKKN